MQANDTLVRGSPATIVIPACEDIAINHQGGCRRPCQTAYWEGNCQLAEMKVARPESSRRRGWYEALYCNPRRSSDAQTCSSGATGLPPRVGWFSLVYNLTPRPMKNSDSGAEGEPMKRTASMQRLRSQIGRVCCRDSIRVSFACARSRRIHQTTVHGLKSVCYILVIDTTIPVLLVNYASIIA
jgi:hypothetical protein